MRSGQTNLATPQIKILTVFGTRPESIKLAPLALQLRDDPRIEVGVCVTAQHREMLDQVLRLFEIDPDFDLDIVQPGQSLNQITTAARRAGRSYDVGRTRGG